MLKKMTRQTTIQKKNYLKKLQYGLVPEQFSSPLCPYPDCKSLSNVVNTALYSHTGKKHFEFSMRIKSAGSIRSSTSVFKLTHAVRLSVLQ